MTQLIPETSILKSEFDKMVKLNDFEVITQAQLKEYTQEAHDRIVKSVESKLELAKEAATEIRSFTPINVVDDTTFAKSVMFVREAQIQWDQPDPNDIEKGMGNKKTGYYTNTYLNRKLGRVGKKYSKDGSGKDEADDIFNDAYGMTYSEALDKFPKSEEPKKSRD